MNVKILAVLLVIAVVAAPAYFYFGATTDEDKSVDAELSVSGISEGETLSETVTVRFDASPGGGDLTITVDDNLVYIGKPRSWDWDTTLWEDGGHVFEAVYAVKGDSETVTITVTIDNEEMVAPVISIIEPEEGLHGAVPETRFVVNDMNDDVVEVHIKVDGSTSAVPVKADGTYTVELDLADGDHTIEIYAVDEEGLENTSSVDFGLDATSPEIELLPDGGWHQPPLQLTWTGSDENGIDEYALFIDDEERYRGSAEQFKFNGSDGKHMVEHMAWDVVGNLAETSVSIWLDGTPPLTSLDLVEGDYVRGDLKVKGSATDEQGVRETWLLLDGEEIADELPFTIDTTAEDDGPHSVVFGAEDKGHNIHQTTKHLYFDNTPPTVGIILQDNILRGSVPILLTGEDNLAMEEIWVYMDGETASIQDDLLITTDYDDGDHNISAIITDKAGNQGEAWDIITIDNTPPVVDLVEPAGTYYSGEVPVEMSITDMSDIVNCTVYLDGEPVLYDEDGDIDLTEIEDGEHVINGSAIDEAGNLAWKECTITVDNTAPGFADVEPEEDSRVIGEVEIRFTPVDASPIKISSIYIDGAWASDGTSYLWNTSEHDDGWIEIELYLEDEAGNEASHSFEVYIDNIDPPTVWIVSPTDGKAVSDLFTIELNVTAEVNVLETRYSIDGGPVEVMDGLVEEFDIDSSEYEDGLRQIVVSILDDDDNVNSTMVNVTFDNTAPDVSFDQPEDDRLAEKLFEIDAVDETTSVKWIHLFVNGTSVQNGSSSSIDWPGAGADGPYSAEVFAGDEVDNMGSVEKDFWLDLRAPKVWFTAPFEDDIRRRDVGISVDKGDYDIEEVDLYINETWVSDSYDYIWDSTEWEDGEYYVNFTAVDRYDAETIISVHMGIDNTPPDIRFLAPTDYYISGTTSIDTLVFDEYGFVSVEFLLDGTSQVNGTGQIWDWDTTTATGGDHNVTVIAVDNAGNWNWSWMHFFVDNEPPAVDITEPAEDEVVSGTVDIKADVTDNVGVETVFFYLNSELIAQLDSTPYDAVWEADDYPDGEYKITCVAYDIAGNSMSMPVNVTKGEDRDVVVTEPAIKVLSEYDLFGIERIVVEDVQYEGAAVVSTLIPYGILPSVGWVNNPATDEEIDYSTLDDFSSRIAISVWDSPDYAIVVDGYENLVLATPISVYLDAPLLVYGQTTDEALWRLGTVHADQILTMGDTPYNSEGVTVIDEAEAVEYALGTAILNGEEPNYIVVTNPNDMTSADSNTAHMSAFAGAFAAHHRGVVVPVSPSATVIDQACKDTYSLFDSFGLTPEFLNIVGDFKSVPHKFENHGFGNEPSDNRYADRDGNPTTVEVSNGRVLAKELDDLSYYLDRIINYRGYWETDTQPVAPAPFLVPGQWNNNAVIYMGWAAEFAEDSEQHCREYMRNIGLFNTKDDTEVAHAMATAQLMADFAASNFIIINADHGQPTGTMTFNYDDLLDLHPSVAFGVSCSVGRTDGVSKDQALTYCFFEKGANNWLAPTRTAYGSFVQTYPYQPIAAPGLCYLYLRDIINDNLTSGEAYKRAKFELLEYGDSNVNKGTNWQYQHYGDPAWNPYEPNNEGSMF